MSQTLGQWQPSQPGVNAPQVWTNTQTGQQVFGSFNGVSGIRLIDPQSGQPTGYHALVNGQTQKDQSLGSQFLHALPKLGAVVAGGVGLAGLTAGSAGAALKAGARGAADAGADAGTVGPGYAADAANATAQQATAGSAADAALSDSGPTSMYATDANGNITGYAPGMAPSDATTAGGFNWGKFLPQAFSTGLQSVLGARAASSAASQQKQAGQAAAASFSPFAQGGIDAYNKALGMFGIAPVSATPGSIAVRPPAQTVTAQQPYSLASFTPPVPQPQPGQPMPPQPYSLSTFSTGGR